jgi:hypothetical protein
METQASYRKSDSNVRLQKVQNESQI